MAIARKTLLGLEKQLFAHAGLELPSWIVESRAEARMSRLGLEPEAYLSLVSSARGASELSALIEAVRVGETRFFRHAPQVDAVLEVVVPSLRDQQIRSPRVWSAGCATGEEPYTLALVLAKALPTQSPTVLATDVSREALATARRATYPSAALEHIPKTYRAGVERRGDEIVVRRHVAELVTFEEKNLAAPDQPRGFHLVWCRNVLIYFGPEAKERVLAKLVDALEPGGYLFLGYSETLRDVPGLSSIRHGDQVLWQKARDAQSRDGQQRDGQTRPPSRPAETQARASSPSLETARLEAAARLETEPRPEVPRPRRPLTAKKASTLHLGEADARTLEVALETALAGAGLEKLTVDFDAADFVDDDVAPVLRRALSSATASGVRLELRASRPGAQRWLRRHRLPGGDP